jgi:hypothetical protein
MSGCSRKFSYHDAYKFDHHTYAVKHSESLSPHFSVLPPSLQATASAEPDLNTQSPVGISETRQRRLAAAIDFSNKFNRGEHLADTTTNPTTESKPELDPALNKKAKAGFLITLASLLLLPVTLLFVLPLAVGFGLCVVGLKSEKRNLARFGIWATIIYAAFLLVLVIIFAGGSLDV